MPVGGYCYSGDIRQGFYENILKEVGQAEPTHQLEPQHDGGSSVDSGV